MKYQSLVMCFTIAVNTVLTAPTNSSVIDTVEHSPEDSTKEILQKPRIDLPWIPNNGTVMTTIPPPKKNFKTEVSSKLPTCSMASALVESRFNVTCYQGSYSLYFSSPGQVCKDDCFNTTVEMSKYIVDHCGLNSTKISEPYGHNHTDIVYLSWADRDMADLVCNGPVTTDGKKWTTASCYSYIFYADAVRENSEFISENPKESVCSDCSQQWTEKILSSERHFTPILYYGHVSDPITLAKWLTETCEWKKE